jgi:hypothetical protein
MPQVQRLILLIRHAEKPAGDFGGVTEDGRADPHGLSVRGWQRAGALAAWLAGPQAAGAGIAPSALYAAADEGRSHRPYDTLRPLAQSLGLPIRPLPSEVDPAETAAVIEAAQGNVLVCWRHRELPALARALLSAATSSVPDTWDEQRFDLVWVIRGERFAIVSQALLAGDAPADGSIGLRA